MEALRSAPCAQRVLRGEQVDARSQNFISWEDEEDPDFIAKLIKVVSRTA
jgi:hypothetical protein